MRWTFMHAADLHIDSPLAALGLKDQAVAERFAHAGRRAVEALIDETIASKAAFLIIAGDIFDGDWKDVTSGLFFARALGRLDREGVPTFIVKGNHDAESVISKDLPYPASVKVFATAAAESIALESRRVVLHGRSFASRKAPAGFATNYPPPREGWLNIGVLHTSLGPAGGHDGYAPCAIADLQRFGYDYWALGHVHTGDILCRDPWIVYPGNIQGRSVREPGPKGAVRVSVEDGRIVEVVPIALDAARWAHESLDIGGAADASEILSRIEQRLAEIHLAAEGRALAVRLTLVGETPFHPHLVGRREEIEADARAIAFRLAEDCWIEQLKIATAAPEMAAKSAEPDAIDVEALLAAAAADPEFTAASSEISAAIAQKLPSELRGSFTAEAAAPERVRALALDHLLGSLAMEQER